VTAPNAGGQNEHYRQQENRAEQTREEARALRGDDPNEATELSDADRSSDTEQERDGDS